MNLAEFFIEAEIRQVTLRNDIPSDRLAPTLSNEALFQLPLLAMVILMLAKGRKKPDLSEIGQLVGESLERAIFGFKGSSQDIGWSANLRIRTVKALTFLEAAKLITLSREKSVSTTDLGRIVLDSALAEDGRLSVALMAVERAYQNVVAETQIRLRLV